MNNRNGPNLYRWNHTELGKVFTTLNVKHPEERQLLEDLLRVRRGIKLVDFPEGKISPRHFAIHNISVIGDGGYPKTLERLVILTMGDNIVTTCSRLAIDNFVRVMVARASYARPLSAQIPILKRESKSGYMVANFLVTAEDTEGLFIPSGLRFDWEKPGPVKLFNKLDPAMFPPPPPRANGIAGHEVGHEPNGSSPRPPEGER